MLVTDNQDDLSDPPSPLPVSAPLAWGERCTVLPMSANAGVWEGEVVDPRTVNLGSTWDAHPDRWLIVRCTDPCAASGVRTGDEYIVTAAFVHPLPA